jgi:hypothetical protein
MATYERKFELGVYRQSHGEMAKWRNGEMAKWRNGETTKESAQARH